MPPEITRLVDTFLHDPARIEVAKAATTAATITQSIVKSGSSPEEKRATLRRIIRGAEGFKNAIIFCNRKRDVAVVHRSLEKHGFSVAALHGDLDQRTRMAALDAFRNDQVQLLVCSDVAARGLDIPDVSHVINYDAPHHPDDYVHRIGRTGRAGKLGAALTIVTRADQRSMDDIQKLIERKIDVVEGPAGEGFPAEDSVEAEEAAPRGARPPQRSRRHRGESSTRPAAVQEEATLPPARERSPRGERPARPEHARPERAHSEQPRPERAAAPERDRHERRPTPRPAPQPEPARFAAPARRPRHEDSDDRPVIGLGDHVPSFLLRPVKLPPIAVKADAED